MTGDAPALGLERARHGMGFAEARGAMKRILVIDDSPTVRQQVGNVLRQAGFEIAEAVDGIDGAAKIREDQSIAAVLCDVNMPRLNGMDMLEEVKRDPKNAALPIVMLTTDGQPEHIAHARRCGAKGWIIKPFKPELLVAAVSKLVS
jgi:two-component system chemotaxis response regulator CheY